MGVVSPSAFSDLPIPNKLLFSRTEFCQLCDLSERFLDYLIENGTIRVVRAGARVLIPRRELLRFAHVVDGDGR